MSRELQEAKARIAILTKALIETKHVLENIEDPYNERIGNLKKWAQQALVIAHKALGDNDRS